MNQTSHPYLLAQVIFVILFFLSTVLLVFSLSSSLAGVSAPSTPTRSPTRPTPLPSPEPTIPVVSPIPGTSWSSYILAVVLPLLTAFVSLVGFVSTTALAWRKDKRDAGLAQLEIKRQALELEKVKLELEQLKGKGDKKSEEER